MTKTKRLLLLAKPLIGTLNANAAEPAQSKGTNPVGQTGQWVAKPAFSDEFDGTEADPQKWTANVGSWCPWTWDKKNALAKDGRLVLSMNLRAAYAKKRPADLLQVRHPPLKTSANLRLLRGKDHRRVSGQGMLSPV